MILGICNLCGGNVTVPDVWPGIFLPKGKCEDCEAEIANGPILVMKKARKPYASVIGTASNLQFALFKNKQLTKNYT
jgi:hypothetical protein